MITIKFLMSLTFEVYDSHTVNVLITDIILNITVTEQKSIFKFPGNDRSKT